MTVVCLILLALDPVSYTPSSSEIENVAIGELPPQRNVVEVLAFTSTRLAGSRVPKFRLEVLELNLHTLFDKTVAVSNRDRCTIGCIANTSYREEKDDNNFEKYLQPSPSLKKRDDNIPSLFLEPLTPTAIARIIRSYGLIVSVTVSE